MHNAYELISSICYQHIILKYFLYACQQHSVCFGAHRNDLVRNESGKIEFQIHSISSAVRLSRRILTKAISRTAEFFKLSLSHITTCNSMKSARRAAEAAATAAVVVNREKKITRRIRENTRPLIAVMQGRSKKNGIKRRRSAQNINIMLKLNTR